MTNLRRGSRLAFVVLGLVPGLVMGLGATEARAGDGSYDSTTGVLSFGVSIRFEATPQQKARLAQEFGKASCLIADVTDGQQEFGDVYCCNNSRGGRAAEVWVFENGRSNAPGSYGRRGEHINLYYSDVIASSSKADGSWVIAHEFAHHLYGVRDEYSGPTAASGLKCIATPADPSTQTACLTENFWIRGADGVSLTEFCVASNHDPDNDTYQEDIRGKSCWESVIDRYPDLVAPTGLPDAGGLCVGTFEWKELIDDTRLVAIIDRSGSMGSGNRIQLARLGAKLFVNITKEGDKLGVVSFESSSRVDFPMTEMDAAGRLAAKSAISAISSGGGTNIQSGVLSGRGLINALGERSCQQAMVLLSDGQGTDPTATDLANLVKEGIVCHTIALGSGADAASMQNIATKTGGKFFSTSSGFGLLGIFSQLAAELAEGGVLNTRSGTLGPGMTEGFTFAVDGTTQGISFVIAWDTAPGDVEVVVHSPKKDYPQDGSDPDVQFIADESALTVLVAGSAVESGTWSVDATSNVAEGGQLVNVEIHALSDSREVTFVAGSDRASYTYPAPMLITGTASSGPTITRVAMDGVVRRPDGSTAPIRLRDDGTGGDEFAGDGLYSGRFNAWSTSGAYTVALDAVNNGEAKVVSGENIHPSDPDNSSVEKFARHTEFSVTVSGVPTLERFGLYVDSLKLRVTPDVVTAKGPPVNQVALKGTVDLDRSEVNLVADTLNIWIANLGFSFSPDELTRVGKKDRFVFRDQEAGTSGYVDMFRKGSSRGAVVLKDKDFSSFLVPDLGRTTVRFAWGSMDYSTTILPQVSSSATTSKFAGSKDPTESVEFFVTGAKVKVVTKKSLKDKLSFRAKLSDQAFAPLQQSTTINFGSWSVDTEPGDWTEDKHGRLAFQSEDKNVKILFDPETQSLSVSAKKQDLAEFSSPIITEVRSGFSTERREILPAEKVTGSGSSYAY